MDEEEARRQRAAEIHKQIEELSTGAPDEKEEGASEPPENPREFIERKMREDARESEDEADEERA